MKTLQWKALRAYKALGSLTALPFPLRDAYNLMKLRKSLDTVVEFQIQEEQKLVDEYNPRIVDGKYAFEYNPEDPEEVARVREFQARLEAIGGLEIELDFKPVTIWIEEHDTINVKPDDLFDLDGYVEFITPAPEA